MRKIKEKGGKSPWSTVQSCEQPAILDLNGNEEKSRDIHGAAKPQLKQI